MNTGTDQSLAILKSDGTPEWTADLIEDGDPRDEDAHKYRETIPPWHGLSCDGDVTGQLVYANYGLKEVCHKQCKWRMHGDLKRCHRITTSLSTKASTLLARLC